MDQLSGSSGSFALLETLPAINRAALRRLERDCRLTLTAGADSLGFYALIIASALRQTKRLGALALTCLTAFRFVLELFIVEEKLFTGSEDEVSAAVHTLKNLVLELHREMPPFLLHPQILPRRQRSIPWTLRVTTYHGFGPSRLLCRVLLHQNRNSTTALCIPEFPHSKQPGRRVERPGLDFNNN